MLIIFNHTQLVELIIFVVGISFLLLLGFFFWNKNSFFIKKIIKKKNPL